MKGSSQYSVYLILKQVNLIIQPSFQGTLRPSNKKIIPTMLEFVSSIKNTCNFENPYIVGTFQIKPT